MDEDGSEVERWSWLSSYIKQFSSSQNIKIPRGLGSLGPEPGQDQGMGWHGIYGHKGVGWKTSSARAG